MLQPLIRRRLKNGGPRSDERGFTMALVAVSLLAIIAMAALSIDIGTLYQAKAEAQRAADAAALTAARMISISGITGDPTNGSIDGSWGDVCGGAGSPASLAAIKVAQQNLIGGAAASKVEVYYGTNAGVGTNKDCTGAGAAFGINPVVSVYVQQASLPTFFSRIFSLVAGGTSSNSGVSATATAEAYNPSGSGSLASGMIPVQPRCVKPWIIPNYDNLNPTLPKYFVDPTTGAVANPGISQLGAGVIGETFNLNADCTPGAADCLFINGHMLNNPPRWNSTPPAGPPFLEYVPGLISGTPGAVPSGASCSLTAGYQSAVAGCDQSTVYACGTLAGATADLNENPVNPSAVGGDTSTATLCLTNQLSGGHDQLAGYPGTLVFPFQIQAGFGSPLVKAGVVNSNDIITTSNSIVTIPIYDNSSGAALLGAGPQVTIIGFLQVFINTVDSFGNVNVTVLNVAGCGNAVVAGATYANGTSPVPVRLITPP